MKKTLLLLSAVFAISACEQVDLSEEQKASAVQGDGAFLVTFCTSNAEQTRAVVGDLASRCSFCVFHNGERVKTTEHQEKGIDDDFGQYQLRLDEGVYDLVVIAHNGSGNCTITSAEKVTFKNSHITDTFCGYCQFTVSDKDTTIAVDMKRVVARINFTSTSAHPSDVAQLKFYYTGGSSTLNPKTGQGCVQSRQSEIMDVVTPDSYTFYTFPYMNTTSTLKLTVYSLDAQGTELDETAYTGIPVEVNRTTNLTGSLFDKHGVTVTIPDDAVEWGEDIDVSL